MDKLTFKHIPQDVQNSCKSEAWFLAELDLYKTEKPYRLRFNSPDPSVARTNIKNTPATIEVHDIRSYSEPLSYSRNGFTTMKAHGALTAEDSADEEKVKTLYLQSLKPVLCDFFGTPNVVILEYVTRKREESFPVSHGGDYEYNQPVLVAHVDWTPPHVMSRIRSFMGVDKAEKILNGDYQYVHVWKPLKGPVRDWPLALCDISSIDPDKDLEMTDTVFDTGRYIVQENYQMYHRQYHRWFYLSEQETSEITIFRQYDSKIGHGSGVPHVAFPNPRTDHDEEPRESIEVQCLVYWDSA